MAFCAKCGTPLNDAGVCPSCGYVLPQNKRPVQTDNTIGETAVLGNQGNPPQPGAGAGASGQTGPVDIEATVTISQAMERAAAPDYGSAAQGNPQGYAGMGGPSGQPYYGAPGQESPGNGQAYNAPEQNSANAQGYNQNQGYGMPNQGYTAPNQGYTAPNQGYTAPNQGYTAPNQGYAAPNQGPQGYGPGQGGPAGQPYYGQPYPRKSSDFGKNLLQWFLGIFKKDPTEIFDTVGSSKSPVWAVYMAIYAFFGALAVACSVGSFLGIFYELDDVFEDLYEMFRAAGFRFALVSFFIAFLFYVALMFLTSLIVWLTLMICGKKVSFLSACNVMVVAYIPSILASAFSFICSFNFFTSVFAMFVSSLASIATMLLLYCAIHRISGGKRPVLWIYVAAQAVLKIVTVIITVVFVFIAVFLLSALVVSTARYYRYW